MTGLQLFHSTHIPSMKLMSPNTHQVKEKNVAEKSTDHNITSLVLKPSKKPEHLCSFVLHLY